MTVTNKKLYESGLKVRRAVLGAEYVDPQIEVAKTDPVMGAIQDMVTEYIAATERISSLLESAE